MDLCGDAIKKLIIGFSKPRVFLKPYSWAIRAIERTRYSHVFIKTHADSLDSDLIYQASGLQVNFMGLELFENHAQIVAQFEVDVEDDKHREFLRWAVKNSGAPYSIKQVVGIALVKLFNLKKNPLSNGQKAWVCSELAGYVLSEFLKMNMSHDMLDTAGPRDIFNFCQKYLKQIEVQDVG